MEPISFVAAFVLSKEPLPESTKTPPPVANVSISAPPKIVSTIGSLELTKTKFVGPPEQIHCDDVKPEPSEPSEPTQKTNPEPTVTKPKPNPKKPPVYRMNHKVPTSWQLLDRFGIAWTHQDKNYLEQFVAQRNCVQSQPQTLYSVGDSCSGGSCHR